jgi:hypothetical protein
MRRNRTGMLILAMASALVAGCGSNDYKQLRIESGSIASTATEAAALARQRIANRVPAAFTKVQSEALAGQFGKSLQSLGAKPTEPEARDLAQQISLTALAGQLAAASMATESTNRSALRDAQRRLSAIADRATKLSDQAEAKELSQ